MRKVEKLTGVVNGHHNRLKFSTANQRRGCMILGNSAESRHFGFAKVAFCAWADVKTSYLNDKSVNLVPRGRDPSV